jgi:hypothetical protein
MTIFQQMADHCISETLRVDTLPFAVVLWTMAFKVVCPFAWVESQIWPLDVED